MNPQTDLSTQVRLADGRIINVVQPGGKIAKSKNWRLTEEAFRRYESLIREAIAAWPNETCFDIPNGSSPNTFSHRLRDALQALKMYGYDPELQQSLANIREELVVAMDADGSKVWIRAKGKQGRPINIHSSSHERPTMAVVQSTVLPNPVPDVLRAYVVLLVNRAGAEAYQFRGKIADDTISLIQKEHDVAFAYDEAADVTTVI